MSSDRTILEIGCDHTLTLVAKSTGDYLVRLDRPAGTGRPLYETLSLDADEIRALWEAIIDTGEVG